MTIYFIPTIKETCYTLEYNRSLSTDSKVYGVKPLRVGRRNFFDEKVHIKLKTKKVE